MNWHTGRELDRRIAQQEEFQSGANRQESKNTTLKFVVLGGTIWTKQVGVVAVEHIGVIRMLRNQQKIQIFSTLVKKDAYHIEE